MLAAAFACFLILGMMNAQDVNRCEAEGHDRAWCLAILNP
jgi:hypothetical protein